MTIAQYAARPADDEYGHICPECAGPKALQSKRCSDCYHAARRTRLDARPVSDKLVCPECGGAKVRDAARCQRCYFAARERGEAGPRGSGAQPQSHPWRKENLLLYGNFAAHRELIARMKTTPATPGARLRAHFGALTEEAAA